MKPVHSQQPSGISFVLHVLFIGLSVIHSAESVKQLRGEHQGKAARKLRVAVAVLQLSPPSESAQWRDALAVCAFAARKALNQSAHQTDFLAFVPDTFNSSELAAIQNLGLTPKPLPLPYTEDEVADAYGLSEMKKGCCGLKETLKYYGAALTEYDRVLVIDGDVQLLAPFDDLYTLPGNPSLVGTYDYELMAGDSGGFPPVQGGFFLFTPNRSDFDALVALSKEGDFEGGTGWKASNTGWAYGGAGPVGLLSFYYNQEQPGHTGVDFLRTTPTKLGEDLPGNYTEQPPGSRFRPLDRSVDDVLDTWSLRAALSAKRTSISRVRSFHFTGLCMKPWQCLNTRDNDSDLCKTMTDRWWQLRADLAKSRGLEAASADDSCADGEYKALQWPAHN